MYEIYIHILTTIFETLTYRFFHITIALSVSLILVLLLRKPAARNIQLLNCLWLIPLASFFCYNFTLLDEYFLELILLIIGLRSKYIFFIGTIITAIFIRIGTRKIRRVMKASTPCPSELHVMERAKKNVQLIQKIEIRQIRFDTSPFVHGIIRPKVYLPYNWESKYSEQELYMVLIHELTHIKQGDLVIRGFCQILRCIMWYNPLIHIALPFLLSDREILCDSKVLNTSQVLKSEYGQMILKEAVGEKALAMASLKFSSAKGLKHRISTLAKYKFKKPYIAVSTIAFSFFALLSVVIISNSSPTHTEPSLSVYCVEDDENREFSSNAFELEITNTRDSDYFYVDGTTCYISDELLELVDEIRDPETQKTFRVSYTPFHKEIGPQRTAMFSSVTAIRTFDDQEIEHFIIPDLNGEPPVIPASYFVLRNIYKYL
ncbi:MAG: M56 family metallopeptidase [Suipraeoptans sp.]